MEKNNTQDKEIKLINISGRMKAIGFVKSRKSDDKIHALCQEMRRQGLSKTIDLQDFIVDGSAGIDIDRKAIDRLMQRLEQGGFECVAVMSVADFTTDVEDLTKFCLRLKGYGCKVYLIGESRFLGPESESE